MKTKQNKCTFKITVQERRHVGNNSGKIASNIEWTDTSLTSYTLGFNEVIQNHVSGNNNIRFLGWKTKRKEG